MTTILPPRNGSNLSSNAATASTAQPETDTPSRLDQTKSSAYFDLALSLLLHSWNPLTLAVQSQWGGPTSADKRDWIGGVLSDLFIERPATDSEDVEAVLLQIMEDEFDVRLEDESEEQIACDILQWRRICYEEGPAGWEKVESMRRKWEEKQSKRKGEVVEILQGSTEGKEDEWSDESEDSDGGVEVDADQVMGDAPALTPTRTREEPQVDDDGFTKVIRKSRR